MYKIIFLFTFFSFVLVNAQTADKPIKVKGTVKDQTNLLPLANVHILNLNSVKGSLTNDKGKFEIDVKVNDTLYISYLGYQSIKAIVTNDWIKNETADIKLTAKSIALEEITVYRYNLTGYLQIDAKHIPVKDDFRYDIQGLKYGYESGGKSTRGVNRVLGSIFNPADALHSLFGKKGKELRKLREMRSDDATRLLLESKFDREMIAVMLGVDKNELPEILQRCNYSESFINSANDLQILDAVNDCYEEHRILKRRN
jgi:hypothetical protein